MGHQGSTIVVSYHTSNEEGVAAMVARPAANAIASTLPSRHGPNTTFLALAVRHQDPKI